MRLSALFLLIWGLSVWPRPCFGERLVDTPRGDLDFDGAPAFSDVVLALERLFLGGPEPRCPGAADVNLDGRLDVADPIGLVGVLFLDLPLPGGEEPARVPCR